MQILKAGRDHINLFSLSPSIFFHFHFGKERGAKRILIGTDQKDDSVPEKSLNNEATFL